MEFGFMGLEGFSHLPSSDLENQKCCGSAGFLKHERPVSVSHDDDDDKNNNDADFRASKIAKVRADFVSSKSPSFVFSDDGLQEHNMLSFSSSPKLEDFSLKFSGSTDTKNLQKSAFPTYFQYPASAYSKISGGAVNASMYFLNGGGKGAFTAAQWMELEQQALIYKYIVANEPIPPNLLIPIRRALESAGFFSFPGALLRPTSFGYGWGGFQLGLGNSRDPEPGRCRRTDGKKWRCSREAVAEQKYCERHMNRGRHRSRKPVEGRVGHSVSSGSTPPTNLSPNLVTLAADASSRVVLNKQNSNGEVHNSTGHEFISPPTISLNSSVSDSFSIAKDHMPPFAESLSSSPIGFGLLTSDTLYRPYASSHDISTTDRPFIDNPSTSLRLSGELEMGLGLGSDHSHHKHSSWVPISWENSMGGPLGEALKATRSSSDKNVSSALNLLSRGWEGSAPQLTASSPTGVLQRTPLGSLSSSAGSSPRADHGRATDSGGLGI